MNPKIRELADEAKMSTYLLAYGTEFNIAVERFAQLIVQECLTKIEAEAAQYHEPTWAVELVGDIREHFGFEETRSEKLRKAGFTRRYKTWTKEHEQDD